MSDAPAAQSSYEVDCPHCRRTFTAEVMTGTAGRYHGFKCPHCRLFVSYERAEGERLEQPDEAPLAVPPQDVRASPARPSEPTGRHV